MSTAFSRWPGEPVVPTQSLSETGLTSIPDRYIKSPNDRPAAADHISAVDRSIPVIDLANLNGDLRAETLAHMSRACEEWGFFQLVNHGVSSELMRRARAVWRAFFDQPLEAKMVYANEPKTYVGYGSRVGLEKDAVLDWSDYFFLHLSPVELREEETKWPAHPPSCREVTKEYGEEVMKVGGKIMKALSINLGLDDEDYLETAFGGPTPDACMRVGFYPKCPQPDLTLGLSSHSDPGGLTILLPDQDVAGLQVRHSDGSWVTVHPIMEDALVVNMGDQVEVVSNGLYKSVEHRVMANSHKNRLSLACFYNPRSDVVIEPAKELVSPNRPQAYPPMTFAQYRLYIRTKGPHGKAQVHSLRSSTLNAPPTGHLAISPKK